MSIVILFYVIIIPLIPLITGRYLSIAPLGGPLAIISLQLFLGVTLKSIYLQNNYHLYSTKFWLQRSNNSFEQAVIFMSLFSFFLCLGYWLNMKSENNIGLKNNRKNFYLSPLILNKKSSFVCLFIAITVSLGACFLYLKQRGLVGLSIFSLIINANISKVTQIDGLKNANFGATFAFTVQFFAVTKIYLLVFFSNIIVSRKQKNHQVGFAILLILCLFQIIITGKRNEILGLVAPLIIISRMPIYNGSKINFPFKTDRYTKKPNNKFLIIFIPASVIMFAFITYVRGGFDDSLGLNILLSYNNLLEPVLESTYFTDINILASIMERMRVHDMDFMFGQSYLSLIYGFVPRFLWSDKPAISLGIFVKNEIFGLRGTLGGIPPTMPGEAFINFGWLSLIIPLIYGFTLRKFEYIIFRTNSLQSQLRLYLYTLVVFPLTWSLMQSSFAITVNGIVSLSLLTYIFWKMTYFISNKYKSINTR